MRRPGGVAGEAGGRPDGRGALDPRAGNVLGRAWWGRSSSASSRGVGVGCGNTDAVFKNVIESRVRKRL